MMLAQAHGVVRGVMHVRVPRTPRSCVPLTPQLRTRASPCGLQVGRRESSEGARAHACERAQSTLTGTNGSGRSDGATGGVRRLATPRLDRSRDE